MRIIGSLLLVAASVLFLNQTARCQMLAPGEIQPQKVGSNCLVYHLRKGRLSNDSDITNHCQSPKGWLPTSHDNPFVIFPTVMAFYNAESTYCGSAGCTAPDKDIRLVLIGDPLPNVFIVASRASNADESDAVSIFITTTLVDFVQRNGQALLNDLLEDPELAPQGFNAWLAGLRALGGKSCSLPVKWNTTSVSPKISEDLLLRIAMTTFQILFAHEIAHLRLNQTCGYQRNPTLTSEMNALGVERACDRVAFAQLTKSGIAMPLFAVAALVAWQDYITLKRPQLAKDFAGGESKFREAFPALHLKERAQLFVDDWEAACRGGLTSPMCNVWQESVVKAKKIINSTPPAACIP